MYRLIQYEYDRAVASVYPRSRIASRTWSIRFLCRRFLLLKAGIVYSMRDPYSNRHANADIITSSRRQRMLDSAESVVCVQSAKMPSVEPDQTDSGGYTGPAPNVAASRTSEIRGRWPSTFGMSCRTDSGIHIEICRNQLSMRSLDDQRPLDR